MKTTMVISLIVVAVVVFWKKQELQSLKVEKNDVHQVVKSESKPSEQQYEVVKTAQAVEEVEADLDSIEEKFKSKEVAELESILNGMEKMIESRNLFALANQGLLTEEDTKELSYFLRSKAVIAQLIFEKKLEEVREL